MTTQRTHYVGCHRFHLACARERVRQLGADLAEAEEALARLERAQAAQGSRGRRLAVITTHPAHRERGTAQTGAQALNTTTDWPEGPEAA